MTSPSTRWISSPGVWRAVELVVEAEHVAGHPQPQLVRRAPRRDGGVADDDDADRLRRDGDGEEDEGERRRTSRVLGPSVASSTIVRTTSGPASASAELAARSAPRTAQRRASGRSRASEGAPRDGDAVGTSAVSLLRAAGTQGVSRSATRHDGGSRPLPTAVGASDSLACMEKDTATLEAPESTDELVEEELLVEEISIDGMCGVY